jgi:hypothetical protein
MDVHLRSFVPDFSFMDTARTQRQVKGTVAKTVLSYVRRSLGPTAVERVFELAGRQLAAQGLAEPASWTTAPDTLAIAEAAAEVCGDADIGRRAGEELMRLMRERGTVDFVRGAGSIPAALELTINSATKMSSGRAFELAEAGDGYAVIVATYTEGEYAHPFFCAHTAGFCATVPEVFGYIGVTTETQCQGRGDDRCVYRLSWSTSVSDRTHFDVATVEASRARIESYVSRFEQLHTMATEFAQAEELETLLARVTEQAGVAVAAQRYLIAVRSRPDSPLSIHHDGFADDIAAEKFAAGLLASELDDDDRVLVADVTSAWRRCIPAVRRSPTWSVASWPPTPAMRLRPSTPLPPWSGRGATVTARKRCSRSLTHSPRWVRGTTWRAGSPPPFRRSRVATGRAYGCGTRTASACA